MALSARWTGNYSLSPLGRLFWLGVNGLLGAVPSLLFFSWVERGGTLPYLPIELGWPWLSWPNASLALQGLWDFSLFLAFGLVHSALAQHRVHTLLRRVVPPQAIRTLFLAVTGVCLFLLMSLWQPTGILLWAARLPARFNIALSLVIFWSALASCGILVGQLDLPHFLGLKQIYLRARDLDRPGGTPKLLQDGIYGWVRHPVYTLTLAAFLLTPVMTLDRLLIAGAMFAYLAFGIPVEERKLIATFGPAYEKYRGKVPALIPFRFSHFNLRPRAKGNS